MYELSYNVYISHFLIFFSSNYNYTYICTNMYIFGNSNIQGSIITMCTCSFMYLIQWKITFILTGFWGLLIETLKEQETRLAMYLYCRHETKSAEKWLFHISFLQNSIKTERRLKVKVPSDCFLSYCCLAKYRPNL